MPELKVVRCAPCPKERGALKPISDCYMCNAFGAESGMTVYCRYSFVPVGEKYGEEAS